MANRLIDSTSPYLLQHATNPVDWYPWGPEALARAKAEQKPIFLSIGYAACHWCHVMEHLVFERGDIAALMNQHFINIKVDREERPDLDDLYMLATQLMTGQGGWPMSVWLTPELEPFYAGTYFPPEDAHGRPGFPRLLLALSEAWTNKRGELLNQSHRVVEAIRMHANEGQPATAGEHADASLPVRHWLHQAVDESSDRFDDVNGGLGGAPKFPPHQHLMLWLELAAREEGLTLLGFDAREALGGKITKTLDGMMNGGIYDHVGGGFARYSTDEKWLVPHFEKMLYDSAQLAPIYAMASVAFGRPEYARVARETLDFFLREMRSPEGAFYSSLDADSEGEEGKYYVWTLEDVRTALPDATEADRVIRHFGMTSEGNWHESPVRGGSVLAVPEGVTPDAALPALLERMRAYRAKRIAPRLDDKILTAWNGLMLSALAICGSRLKEERYLRAARELADFLLTRHVMSGQLLRVSRGGPAHTPAFLDDHAYLLNGLLDLAEADAESEKYLAHATTIARLMISNFSDEGAGGFFFTGAHHEQLFARMKNAADNATPSANGIAIWALLRLARALGDDTFRRPALRAVQAFHANIDRRPEYFPTLLRGLFDDLAGHDMPAEARRPHLPMAGRADKGVVQFSVTGVAPDEAAEEIAFDVTFRVGIAAGYHIQSTDAAEKGIMQTTARLRALGRTRLASQAWKFPPPSSNGYAGTIEVKAKAVLANPDAGKHSFRATLMAQPCSEVACLEPVTVTTEFILDMS